MADTPSTASPAARQYVDYDEFVDLKLEKAREHIKKTDIFTTLTTLSVVFIAYLLLFVVFDQWVFVNGFSDAARLVLLMVVVGGCGTLLTRRVIVPLLKRVHPLYAARVIEQADPNLKSNLINFVDVRESQAAVASPGVMRAMEKRAAVELSHIDVDDTIDRRPLLRMAYALLGVVVISALYILFSPKDPFTSVRRALLPTASIDVATETTIGDVTPGDDKVPARSQLTIEADVRGRHADQVQILYTTADHKYVNEPVEMRRIDPDLPRFRGTLNGENGRGLLQSLTYAVTAGDARTRPYQIEVVQPPTARVDAVHYAFPSYMQFEERTAPGGAIDGWEGATVTVTATANMPLQSAMIVLVDTEDAHARGEEIAMQVSGETKLEGKWKLEFRSDGTAPRFYYVQVKTARGETDPDPTVHSLRIRPDQRPEVTLLSPTGDLEKPANAIIPLVIQATDPDFQLRSIALKAEKDGEELPVGRLFEDRELGQSFRGRYDFRLEPFRLRAGDTIQYWIEARDNKQPTANRATTPRLSIRILKEKSAEEIRQDLARDRQAQEDQIARADEAVNSERPEPLPGNEPGEDEPAAEPGERPAPEKGTQPEPASQREQAQRPDPARAGETEKPSDSEPPRKKRPGEDYQRALEQLLQQQQQEENGKEGSEEKQPGQAADNAQGNQQREVGQGKRDDSGKSQPREGAAQNDTDRTDAPRDDKNDTSQAPRAGNRRDQVEKPGSASRPQEKTPQDRPDPDDTANSDEDSSENPQDRDSSSKGTGETKPRGKQGGQRSGEKKPGEEGIRGDDAGEKNTEKEKPGEKDGGDNNDAQKAPGQKDGGQKNAGQKNGGQKTPGKKATEKNSGDEKESSELSEGADSKTPAKAGKKRSPPSQKNGANQNPGEKPDGEQTGDKSPGESDSPADDRDVEHSPADAGQKNGAKKKPEGNKPDTESGQKTDEGAGEERSEGDDPEKSGDNSAEGQSAGDEPKGSKSQPDRGAGKKPTDPESDAGGSEDSDMGESEGEKGQPSAPSGKPGKPMPGDASEGSKTSDPGSKNPAKKSEATDGMGEEQPAESSGDAEKRQATGDEEGPAEGSEEPDPNAKRAKNDVEREPGSKPGATQKSSEPSQGKKRSDGTKPQEGDPGATDDPRDAQRTPDGKKSSEQPGRTENPPSKKPTSKSRDDQNKQPGDPPNAGNQDKKGQGRKGGQQSEQPETGEDGKSAASDQGAKGSNKEGPGDRGEQPGESEASDGQEGKAGGKPGDKQGKPSRSGGQPKPGGESGEAGEQNSDSEGGQAGKKAGSGKSGGKPGDGGQPKGQPGAPGSARSSEGGGVQSTGKGEAGPADHGDTPDAEGDNLRKEATTDDPEPDDDRANLEYARKATNLLLRRLQKQLERGEVDQELLDEMGWKGLDDVAKFTQFLEQNLKNQADDGSAEALARKLQFEELLKSLRLGNETAKRQGGQNPERRVTPTSARNVPVPPEYREQYEAYTRSLAKQKAAGDSKPAKDPKPAPPKK